MNEKYRDALTRALAAKCPVHIRRRLERGSVAGYVVGIGPELFLMLVLGESLRFNGFQVFRHRD